MSEFPGKRLRWFYGLYTLVWVCLLPVVVLYLGWRGRRDPLYFKHLGERFGGYGNGMPGAIWVHAVSLGELRSAVPLIRCMLADGEIIVITLFTATGRREAETVFAKEIAAGQIRVVWIPLEYHWCYRRFFKAFQPRYGLVMEIEVWPVMIRAARNAGVRLFPCNAQYPLKSFTKDINKSKWRRDLYAGYAGAFVKSGLQRDRFAAAGTPNIHVTGELRFDQTVPVWQVTAGQSLKGRIKRRTITITSVVVGEDATYIALIKAMQGPDAPLFIYVPRAPERFDESYDMLVQAGFKVARRSNVLGPDLETDTIPDCDVLLGDSMGEMYFYLALCDQAVIGGSFVPKGAHNISEALALSKPVVCGPHTWTIEFPFVEAEAAGAAVQVPDQAALIAYIQIGKVPETSVVKAFFDTQSGAVERTYAAIKIETTT